MNLFRIALLLIFVAKQFFFAQSVTITSTSPSIVRTGNDAIPRTPLTNTLTSFSIDETVFVIVVPEIVAATSHSISNVFSQNIGITSTKLISASVITSTINGNKILYETINYYAVPLTTSMSNPTNIYSTIIIDICPSCVVQETSNIEEVELYTSYSFWSETFVTTYSTFETSQTGTQITTYYVKTPCFNETSYTTTGWTGSFVKTYSTTSYLTTGNNGYDTYYTLYYIKTPDQAITSYTTTGWTGTFASTYSTFTTFAINDGNTIYSTLYYIETPYFNVTNYTTTGWTGSFVKTYSTTSYLTTGNNGYDTYYTLYYIKTPDQAITSYTTTGWTGTFASTYSTFTTFAINDGNTIYSTLYYIETPYFNVTNYTTTGWTGSFVKTYSTTSYLTTGNNGYDTYYTLYYIKTPYISKAKLTNITIQTSSLVPIINKDSISLKGYSLPISTYNSWNITKKSAEPLQIITSNQTKDFWPTNSTACTKAIFSNNQTTLNIYKQPVLTSLILFSTSVVDTRYSSNCSTAVLSTKSSFPNNMKQSQSINTSLANSSMSNISIYYDAGCRFSLSMIYTLFGLLLLI